MALTLQRKLELAGALSKMQPQLQRLHLLEKPKPRHRLRNAALVAGVIAAAAVVAAVVCRRRGCRDGLVAGNGGDAQAGFPAQSTTGAAPDRGGVPEPGAHEPHDTAAHGPA